MCIFIASKYFVGGKGILDCRDQKGKNVLSKVECEVACNVLDIEIGTLKDDKTCYVGGNGKCKQTGQPGTKASLVCNKNGNGSAFDHINIFIYDYMTVTSLQYLSIFILKQIT